MQTEAVAAENKVYYIRDAEKYEYNLTDPISAFISIETEEAYNFLATRNCIFFASDLTTASKKEQ